jgi:hypothetical protein
LQKGWTGFSFQKSFYRVWAFTSDGWNIHMYHDHAPVLLQLEITPLFKAYPFKLNSQWLLDQDFIDIVQKVWNDPKFLFEGGK